MGWFERLIGRKKGVKEINTDPTPAETRTPDPNLQSPGGLRVVVSVGPKVEPCPKATEHFGPVETSTATVVWKCGHVAPAKFAMDMYGETHQLKPGYFKSREKCGECLALDTRQHSIRCGKCGHIIFSGEGLAIYGDNPKQFPNRHWITFHRGNVVGCMRADCCPSGAFFFATWDGEKIVPYFEGGTAGEEAVRTGQPVCDTIEE